jgi:CheY-like chemotaxis protein
MTDTPQQRTIMLIDDDKFLLDMYAMKFTQEGFTVQAVLSAADAIRLLEQGVKPDAILFDLVMPVCDGFMFLQKLNEEKLGIGALKIALTNQNTDAEKAKAKELGADDYLVKATLIPSEVVNTISAALSKHKAS